MRNTRNIINERVQILNIGSYECEVDCIHKSLNQGRLSYKVKGHEDNDPRSKSRCARNRIGIAYHLVHRYTLHILIRMIFPIV